MAVNKFPLVEKEAKGLLIQEILRQIDRFRDSEGFKDWSMPLHETGYYTDFICDYELIDFSTTEARRDVANLSGILLKPHLVPPTHEDIIYYGFSFDKQEFLTYAELVKMVDRFLDNNFISTHMHGEVYKSEVISQNYIVNVYIDNNDYSEKFLVEMNEIVERHGIRLAEPVGSDFADEASIDDVIRKFREKVSEYEKRDRVAKRIYDIANEFDDYDLYTQGGIRDWRDMRTIIHNEGLEAALYNIHMQVKNTLKE